MTLLLLFRFASLAALFAFVTLIGLRSSRRNAVPWTTTDEGQGARKLATATRRWLDPKTVVLKNSGQDTNLASMRIVAFGTSKTWGAGLEDPNDSYAKLLSPSAVNLGLRATPADYPSLCTHSMIGDQIFDVIILEFSPNRGQHRDFDRLAKRLRARFPYAIIIHLPIFMLLNDVDYRGRSLQEHLISSGVQSPKESAFFDTIRSANELDLTYPALANQLDWYKETLASIGGYMIEFPTYQIDVKNLVIENAKYYGNRHSPWDFVHPNELGHEFIAHKIRQKVARIFAEEPRDHGATRDWSGKDQCLSWFLNGNVTGDIQNMHQMSLHQFNPEGDGKWALDVNPIGGSFTVECTFPKCSIYISHMAMGPHRQYPRALVSLNDQEPKLVDPLLYNYHLTQIVHVGTMEKPGIATVHVKPIPEDVDSALPFRITGVIRTPTV